jgi:hypothetical protein
MSRILAEIASEHVSAQTAEIANLTASSFFVKTNAALAYGDRVEIKLLDASFPGEVAFVTDSGEPGAVVVFDAPPSVIGAIAQLRSDADVVGRHRPAVAPDKVERTDPTIRPPELTADVQQIVLNRPPLLALSTDDLFPGGLDKVLEEVQSRAGDTLDAPTLPPSAAIVVDSDPTTPGPVLTAADALALAEQEIATINAAGGRDLPPPPRSASAKPAAALRAPPPPKPSKLTPPKLAAPPSSAPKPSPGSSESMPPLEGPITPREPTLVIEEPIASPEPARAAAGEAVQGEEAGKGGGSSEHAPTTPSEDVPLFRLQTTDFMLAPEPPTARSEPTASSPAALAAASALARVASGVGPPRTLVTSGAGPQGRARSATGLPALSVKPAKLPATKPPEPEPELPEIDTDGVTLRFASVNQYQKQHKANIAHGGIIARSAPIAVGTQKFIGLEIPGQERYTLSARVTFIGEGTVGFSIDSFQVHRDKLKTLGS